MSLPQRHQPPSTAMPAALLVVERAMKDAGFLGTCALLNEAQDPWCLCALTWLTADASQIRPALVPFSSHQGISWNILTTGS